MPGRKLSFEIVVSPETRASMEGISRKSSVPVGYHKRVLAILYLDDKLSEKETAARCGLGARIVRKWARRFVAQGLDGLKDKPGRGRKPVFSP